MEIVWLLCDIMESVIQFSKQAKAVAWTVTSRLTAGVVKGPRVSAFLWAEVNLLLTLSD